MYNGSSNPTIHNAIFWGNTVPNDSQISNSSIPPAVYDSVVQGGYPSGTHIITADPRLGVLRNWGGSTETVPLLPGSSAIDAGHDTHCPAADQRGFPRPHGPHCDIGAFEYQPFTLTNQPFIRR